MAERRTDPNYGRGPDSPEVHRIKEELRFARQTLEQTDRDDARGNVIYWEAKLRNQLKVEDAANG